MVLGFEQPSSIEPNRRHSGRNPRSCSRQDFEQPRLARIASAQLEPCDDAFQVSPGGSTCISCSSYSAQRKARILSTGIVIFSGPQLYGPVLGVCLLLRAKWHCKLRQVGQARLKWNRHCNSK